MGERSPELSMALDQTSDRIERHLETVSEVQKELEQIAAGKTLLVVDTTLGNPPKMLERGLAGLHDNGWGEIAQLYVEKLFGGKENLPQDTGEIFQSFFGKNVRLATWKVGLEEEPSSFGKIDAVVFTGSPANVSDALTNPENRVHVFGKETDSTHGFIYDTTSRLFRQAAEQNVPVLGICYGQQMIAQELGGSVQKADKFRFGMAEVELVGGQSGEAAQLLAGVIGVKDFPIRGQMASYHGDKVADYNPQKSFLLLRAADSEPGIVHGLASIYHGELSGNPQEDQEYFKQLLVEGKHASISVQSHPEYTSTEPLLTFVINYDVRKLGFDESAKVFSQEASEIVTASYLGMFTNFLQKYGSV